MVISGGTHKTLPGPSCGLLLTRNDEIARRLDSEVSPKFVRHSQPHHIAALCATLIEADAVGHPYAEQIRRHASTLSASLAATGTTVLQDGDRVSETHQVFVHVPPDRLEAAYRRALEAGVTLNLKRKPLFHDTGLRLGVQEIARYRWSTDDVVRLGDLISALVAGEEPVERLRLRAREMAALNEFAAETTIARN